MDVEGVESLVAERPKLWKEIPDLYEDRKLKTEVRNKVFLMNKTNRCNEFQLYWYYDSIGFGAPFCRSSGVLSRASALVHFMQL